MAAMDEMSGALAVIGGVVGALLAFSAMLLGGLRLVRWLGLPQDLPEGARYSPPAPPLRPAGDPASARVVAGFQARRRALYARARAVRAVADPMTGEQRVATADACVDAVTLDEAALTTAERVIADLEAPSSHP